MITGHHIANAWDKDNALDDQVAVRWVSDHVRGSFDVIARAAALHVGRGGITVLCKKAEEAGDFWQVALLMSVLAEIVFHDSNNVAESVAFQKQALANIHKSEFKPPVSDELLFAKDALQLGTTAKILKGWNQADFKELIPTLRALYTTDAAKADIMTGLDVKLMTRMFEPLFSLDEEAFDSWIREHNTVLDEQKEITKGINDDDSPGLRRRAKLLELVWCPFTLDAPLRVDEEHHMAMLGERGANIEMYYNLYNREMDHDDLKYLFGIDMMATVFSFSVLPLLYIWGEVGRAHAMLQWHMEEYEAYVDMMASGVCMHIEFWNCMMSIPIAAFMLGCPELGKKVLKAQCNTFDGIESFLTHIVGMVDVVSNKGDYAKGEAKGCLGTFETCEQLIMLSWILTTPKAELLAEHTIEHLFEGFQDAATCRQMFITDGTLHPHLAAFEVVGMCWYSLAFEKMGLQDQQLEFATAGLITDFKLGGVKVRWMISVCHGCIGRALRSQGKREEAAAAFEQAFAACDGVYTFYEAVALRDWKTVVLAGSAKATELDALFAATVAKLGHDNKEMMEKRVSECFVFDD